MNEPTRRPAEAPAGASLGAAVLDIGGDIGAAVVYTTAALAGAEIEIKRHDSGWDGTHTAIRRRAAGGAPATPVYAALFGRLPAGRYQIRLRGGPPGGPQRSIDIAPGQVAEVLFRG